MSSPEEDNGQFKLRGNKITKVIKLEEHKTDGYIERRVQRKTSRWIESTLIQLHTYKFIKEKIIPMTGTSF